MLIAVLEQHSADGRGAACRQETGSMATIMAGGEQKKKKENMKKIMNINISKFYVWCRISEVVIRSKKNCVCAVCFRGRDPTEAAAHRQEGGGCFQLSSYRVGKTNTLGLSVWSCVV